MEVSKLKEYIYQNNKIEYILEQISCKYITHHDNYFTCGNIDGDRKNAIVVYENSGLVCQDYTRDILHGKDNSDIIDLVMYNKNISFFKALKFLCDILGLDYYEYENDDNIPESLKITQMLIDMNEGNYIDDNIKLKPINEKILTYYKPYCNIMFFNDNISYEIQKEFEIGYDEQTNHITIPIRDEIGNLVGVKGRVFEYGNIDNKYIYLERCARSKILFGLHKAYEYIKEQGKVYVGESEKLVMQLWNMGYKNCISTGGKKISRSQYNKISSLGVDVVLCFDKDVSEDEIKSTSSKFIDGISVYAIIDKNNILNEKESPSDNYEKWEILVKNNIYKIK